MISGAAVLLGIMQLRILAEAKQAPRIEIAPGVRMPLINDGVSNRSIWIDAGGMGLDTALSYGDADQQNVGTSLRSSGVARSEIFVTTKVPCCPGTQFPWGWAHACQVDGISAKNATADMQHNLKELGLDQVDLVLMHWPCDDMASILQTWRAMEAMLEAGQTRAIGVSNFNASTLASLHKVAKIKPAVNQCGFGIGHPDSGVRWGSDLATVNMCRSLGVTYEAYSPLRSEGTVNIFNDSTVSKIAAVHSVSNAQVALRWVTQQDIVAVTAASGGNAAEYAKEDLAIFNFNLSTVEMKELAALRLLP